MSLFTWEERAAARAELYNPPIGQKGRAVRGAVLMAALISMLSTLMWIAGTVID